MIIASSLLQIDKFVRLITHPSLRPEEVFCSMNNSQYTDYFIRPTGNNADFAHLQQLVCRVTPDQLLADLRVLIGGNTQYYDQIVSMLVDIVGNARYMLEQKILHTSWLVFGLSIENICVKKPVRASGSYKNLIMM